MEYKYLFMRWIFGLFLFCSFSFSVPYIQYPWLQTDTSGQSIEERISPPIGYERRTKDPVSFAYWLRKLPLKTGKPEVHLYDGRRKFNQSAHAAILDIDVGTRDLQQCADAVMRLRAEYLFSQGKDQNLHFNFTSGDRADWSRWQQGYRPKVSGNQVIWSQTASSSRSYANFKAYLQTVFTFAGTFSLDKEMQAITDPCSIQPGDVFIQGGFPGHAVIVLDVVHEVDTGDPLFMLAQSYMPAQEIHILKNPQDPTLSPWYELPRGALITPEWTFPAQSLKRFQQ